MSGRRLEAFSDGVIAILITIMVLDLKVPHSPELLALKPLIPVFLTYVLSFAFLGICWNNHHHLLQVGQNVGGGVLWANLHLLFWLSLVPFTTNWMAEQSFESTPVALYGFVLFMAGIAFFIFAVALIQENGRDSSIAKAIGNDTKGKIPILICAVAIPVAYFAAWAALVLYVMAISVWLVPDRRMEKALKGETSKE